MLVLRLDYQYTDRDEVEQIDEYAFGPGFFTVEFDYDNRGRLTHERRFPSLGGDDVYNLTYEYDQGGNRTAKMDTFNYRRVVYYYDVDGPSVYGSVNNRLMYYKTFDTGGFPHELLSTTYYYYSDAGNVMRIVTNEAGSHHYAATRFGYAQNGQAVTYILGEEWDWDGDLAHCPTRRTPRRSAPKRASCPTTSTTRSGSLGRAAWLSTSLARIRTPSTQD